MLGAKYESLLESLLWSTSVEGSVWCRDVRNVCKEGGEENWFCNNLR